MVKLFKETWEYNEKRERVRRSAEVYEFPHFETAKKNMVEDFIKMREGADSCLLLPRSFLIVFRGNDGFITKMVQYGIIEE